MLAQVSSYEFCKISKNTFSYRTPLVAASVLVYMNLQFEDSDMFSNDFTLFSILVPFHLTFFSVWQLHDQLWANIDETSSLTLSSAALFLVNFWPEGYCIFLCSQFVTLFHLT